VAIRAMGMSNVVGGAWMGGTIDATGAVAAAGSMLGEDALQVAATVKMIQNILIGVVAFAVALFWVFFVERGPEATRPGAIEIWRRFPKFIFGFVAASIVFSVLYTSLTDGPQIVDAALRRCGGGSSAWRSSASAWKPTFANWPDSSRGASPWCCTWSASRSICA